MRLVQVAKALGMTGQDLRHEIAKVDFGVKPTDREIPDNLAQGIVRYIARVRGIEVDMEALGFDVSDEGAGEKTEEKVVEEVAEEKEVKEKASEKKDSLHVLRKLTLENVSQEAIAKQEKELTTAKPKAAPSPSAPTRSVSKPKVSAADSHQEQIKKKVGPVQLPEQVTVKEFAEKTGIQVPKIIQALMKNGVMATVNQTIDYDTAAIVAAELGVDVLKEQGSADIEHLLTRNLEELLKDEPENMSVRPPIVVVMGHVDHGKTAILDAIRQSDVVASEAGGITQHIGAYQIEHVSKGSDEKHKITFLDTPGHEAFTSMRARGAQVTDIAVIVVSAEEGVKPTTIEAIDHAKDAGVPVVVAINKMDRPNADPDKVKGELAGHGLQTEDWGGTTPFVLTSAISKQGIDELLDSIVLLSEMEELKANPNRASVATVIESHLDPSLGALATMIVNTGTLKVGDIFVCGQTTGKVRALMDATGSRLKDVGPSGAVRVSGCDGVPEVGDILQVVSSEKEARELVQAAKLHSEQMKKKGLLDLVTRLSEGKLTQLKVVLKADTQGSLEAIKATLSKLASDEVNVKVIHGAIGDVSESDVMMAAASDGVVIAFHANVPPAVMRTAEREGVQVREYDVVYTLFEDVEGLVKGLVEPEEEEKVLGHVQVRGVFLTKKSEQIIGGKVTDGVIKRLPFRLQRDGEEVGTGRITSLKHVEKDIKEAKEGSECGMRVDTSTPVQEGDIIEVYLKEFKKKD